MFRDLCEGYLGVNPLILQEMTVDQVLVMCCDRTKLKHLSQRGRVTTGTADQLIARGVLPSTQMSFVERLHREMKKEAQGKSNRKARRQQRVQQIIEYKRQLEASEG